MGLDDLDAVELGDHGCDRMGQANSLPTDGRQLRPKAATYPSAMNRTGLNPFEYFALHSLAERRPLFRWEEDAVTPEVMENLRRKGLVEHVDALWVLTRLGAATLRLKPITVLARIPGASNVIPGEHLVARRVAKWRKH
ncbi:hypothetical protein [Lysobacter sp. GCM10012299]|uniref:hypothetical protein n=1 Tax=Lysobacter sp. GCM10012299 TaxID=3317333 RepID=UPI0036176ADE